MNYKEVKNNIGICFLTVKELVTKKVYGDKKVTKRNQKRFARNKNKEWFLCIPPTKKKQHFASLDCVAFVGTASKMLQKRIKKTPELYHIITSNFGVILLIIPKFDDFFNRLAAGYDYMNLKLRTEFLIHA